MKQTILVTGGIGYIGSHTLVELSKTYHIVVIDNLSNSSMTNVHMLEELIFPETFELIIGNVGDTTLLSNLFATYNIYAVIHFAALKSVSESVSNPLLYYENNVGDTIQLLRVMEKHNVKRMIFSSSATVYGNQPSPLDEMSQAGMNLTNPYGKTKYMIEEILHDLKDWNIIVLRYFNPVGAHESGKIGENPNGIPNNLMPFIINVAKNHYFQENNEIYDALKIFGDDYNTHDGTGVRDYIHVVDLAVAHVKALEHLDRIGVFTYNIGTSKGTSVLELVHTFEKVNGVKVPYTFFPRRKGDVDECYCLADKAWTDLGWKSVRNIEDMCRSSWNFVLKTVTQ